MRVSSLTRATGAAAVVLVGVVGLYVKGAFPGHQTASHPPQGGGTASVGGSASSAGTAQGAASGGGASTPGGLSGPGSAPVVSPAPAPVVSGAS